MAVLAGQWWAAQQWWFWPLVGAGSWALVSWWVYANHAPHYSDAQKAAGEDLSR